MKTHPIVNTIKSRTPAVQAMIKKVLKVNSGKQNTQHIIAVSHGYSDYNTLLGLTNNIFYTIQANLGTTENPFFITQDVGEFETEYHALNAAGDILRSCQKNLRWTLLANDKPTSLTVDSYARPQRGLNVQIEIQADTFSDIELALENMTEHAQNEITSDYQTHGKPSYRYEVVGEEYDRFASNDIVEDEDEIHYVVASEDGLVLVTHDQLEAQSIFSSPEDDTLTSFLGRQVTLEQARARESDTFFAVSRNTNAFIFGDLDGVLDKMGDYDEQFILCLALIF